MYFDYYYYLDVSFFAPLVLAGFALVISMSLISWVISLVIRTFIHLIKGR